jgi:formylglycine-generating enzyme required for sulfatase activity
MALARGRGDEVEVTVDERGFRSVVWTLSVERGTTADIDCLLERIPLPKPVIPATPADATAHLDLTSIPAGTKVYADVQDTRKVTACTMDVELGVRQTKRVEIGLKLDGCKRIVRTITLERGATIPLNWPLERLKPQPVPLPGSNPLHVPQGRIRSRINPKNGAEMAYVPAGELLMGSTDAEIDAMFADLGARVNSDKKEEHSNEAPQRRVYLDAYWMYKNDVTVAQYRKFCEATGREMPKAPEWGWKEDHSVVDSTSTDAKAYCDWAGVALSTEVQWEKAARGTDGRQYPWGNTWHRDNLLCSIDPYMALSTGPCLSASGRREPVQGAGHAWQRVAVVRRLV